MSAPARALGLIGLLLWWPAATAEPVDDPEVVARVAEVHRERGRVYLDRGNWDAAIVEFQRALELTPLDAWSQYLLGFSCSSKAYERDDRQLLDKAEAAYKKAIEIQPTLVEALNELGTVYGALGRYIEAIELYERAIAVRPDWELPRFNVADAYRRRGEWERALAEYRWLREHAGSSASSLPRVYSGIGQVRGAQGNLEEAATAFRKALELQPNYYAAHVNLGNVYFEQRRLDDAIAEYQLAIRLEPGNPELYYVVGQMYALRKNDDSAMEWLERAVQKGFSDRDAMARNPLLKRLRNHPQFLKLTGEQAQVPGVAR